MIKLSALVFQHFFRVLLRSNGEGVGKGPTIADGLSVRHGQEVCCLTQAYSASAMDTTLFPLNSSVR